jgi:enediyne polyketide synthase
MARISADAEMTRSLCAHHGLYVAAYEGPRTHVLTGSAAGVRQMARQAGAAGVPVELLGGVSPMHSPAMARCAAPLRAIFAGTCFAPPRRRLVSTVTGRPVTPGDDIAELLSSQVSLPVRFDRAIAHAARRADLIVMAGPGTGLAAGAAECGGVPAVAVPGPVRPRHADAEQAALAEAVAALFAAGAITDLMPFLAATSGAAAATLASGTVPRMRAGEARSPAGLVAGLGGEPKLVRGK